jgi:phosphopantetheinyl transferase
VTSPTTVFLAESSTLAGVAPQLVEHALGAEAVSHYLSPERTFPLQHRNRYYSVSHTAHFTAVAISSTAIGIDVEQSIASDAAVDLMWALSDNERSELAHGDERSLTEIWTAKESSGKAIGLGLGQDPRLIDTQPVSHMSGLRITALPRTNAGHTQALIFGWWHRDHHISIAWPRTTIPSLQAGRASHVATRNAEIQPMRPCL